MISTYSRVRARGLLYGRPYQPSTTCGPDWPSPRTSPSFTERGGYRSEQLAAVREVDGVPGGWVVGVVGAVGVAGRSARGRPTAGAGARSAHEDGDHGLGLVARQAGAVPVAGGV